LGFYKKIKFFLNLALSQNNQINTFKIYSTFCELYNEDLFDLFFTENDSVNFNNNVNNLSKNSNTINHFVNSGGRIQMLSTVKLLNYDIVNNGKKKVLLKEKDKYFCIPGKGHLYNDL